MKNEYSWNPWHGCHKLSPGCLNCYVYRRDSSFSKDSSNVTLNNDIDLPIRKNKKGKYKIPSGSFIYTCFTSDFFLDETILWRKECFKMIKDRSDCMFLIITKRIDNFTTYLPDDWNNGYDNVIICSTVENQDRADYRLPILKSLPIKHKMIICEPILESIDLSKYLDETIEGVVVGGESGPDARLCDYNWVLNIKQICDAKNIPFMFKQTGANFKKDNKIYHILRKYQHSQAKRANLDTWPYR